jgi:hypothetical protein
MKKNLFFSVLAVALLLGFGSTGFASSFINELSPLPDPLSTSDSLLWKHDLTSDFGGAQIDISDARLVLDLEILGENSGGLYTITGYGTGDGIGDGIGLGYSPFGSAGKYSSRVVHEWELDDNLLHAIEEGKELDVVLQLFLFGTGTATVNSSTLSGNASVVPIPTALLLLGSGIVCVVSYRRKSRA